MVQIESYNPFSMFLKMNLGMPTDFNIKEFKKMLESAGFEIPEEQQTGFPFKLSLPIEAMGEKNNVEIHFNIPDELFIVTGENSEEVKTIFEELFSLLDNKYDDIDEIISFYGLNIQADLKSEKNPLESMNNSLKLDLDMFNDINPDTSVIGIRIRPLKKNLEQNDHVEVVIEPKRGSHSSRYQVKMKYQSKDKDKVFDFPFEDELINIISSLEGE